MIAEILKLAAIASVPEPFELVVAAIVVAIDIVAAACFEEVVFELEDDCIADPLLPSPKASKILE